MNRAQRRKAKKLSKPKIYKWENPRNALAEVIKFEALEINQVTTITVAKAFDEAVRRLALFKCGKSIDLPTPKRVSMPINLPLDHGITGLEFKPIELVIQGNVIWGK